jgi:outer membrane receptor for ferrienterochelin and colicin
VVTALGVKREKRNLTFSSQEIKAEELVRSKEPNILNAMTGKVAGVQITSSSGTPGSSSRIVIRGVTSIIGNNEALIVVDGIPVNNSETGSVNSGPGSNRLIDFDPAIIESVNVLKGAAATVKRAGLRLFCLLFLPRSERHCTKQLFKKTYAVHKIYYQTHRQDIGHLPV